MIRTLTLALALSTSFTALSVVTASAQVTEQTDQSEEDWRKSKKKSGTSDIFEDILNSGNSGQGTNQYPQDPMDSLPEESRRHLMKERAKIIATTEPGDEVDAPFTPSDAAKGDPELAEQEKEAWTFIMTDMESSSNQGPSQQGGSGPNKVAVIGQGGAQGSDTQGSGSGSPSSIMRGGSSQSVADIMAQIKGLGTPRNTSGSSNSGSNDTNPSNSPLGTGSQVSAQSPAEAAAQNAANAQSEASNAMAAATAARAQADVNSNNASDVEATAAEAAAGQAQAKADTAAQYAQALHEQAANQAEKESQAQADAQAAENSETHPQTPSPVSEPAVSPESISPLERIKQTRSLETSGNRTSASDYLNQGQTSD